MTDVNTELVEILRCAAGDEVHLERFLADTRAAGLRYRRRRRLVGIVTGAAGLALVAGIGATLPWHLAGGRTTIGAGVSSGGSASPSAVQVMTELPKLPSVAEGSSILTRPESVGNAPVIHLSFDALPFPAVVAEWTVGEGAERMYVQPRDDISGIVRTTLSRTSDGFTPLEGPRTEVAILGIKATMATGIAEDKQHTVLRWEPAPGLYLEMVATFDGPKTVAIAQTLRLDRAYRCAVPFRLTDAAGGAVLQSCRTVFFSGSVTGRFSVRGEATVAMGAASVRIGQGDRSSRDLTESIGGHPGLVVEHADKGGKKTMEVWVDFGGGITLKLTAEGPYDPAAVRRLAAGLVPERSTDSQLWPGNPLVG